MVTMLAVLLAALLPAWLLLRKAQVPMPDETELVDRIEQTIERARRATLIGREAMPEMAGEILPVLDEYATFVPQYREVLGCVP